MFWASAKARCNDMNFYIDPKYICLKSSNNRHDIAVKEEPDDQ